MNSSDQLADNFSLSSDPEQLLETVMAFIQTDSWTESQHFLEQHSELLTDEADDLLGQMIVSQTDEFTIAYLEQHRVLLRRCREVGVEQAFAEESGNEIPEAVRVLWESLQAFLSADNWTDSRHILEQHPELLDEEIASLLGLMIAAQDDQDARAYLEQHCALLRKCREVGVEQAFAEQTAGVPEQFQSDLRQAQQAEQRYLRTDDRAALDEAVAAWGRILDYSTFSAAPKRFQLAALNNIGGVFLRRYWSAGRLPDLNQALHCWEQAVKQSPTDSPNLAGYLNNLGIGLSDRYARTRDPADLVRAIEVYEQAVAQTPESSPDLPGYLNNLGTGLRDRYIQVGDLKDLERAIVSWEKAVEQTPDDSPDLPYYLTNLGNGLVDRFAIIGDLDDLSKAIEMCKQAVERTSADSPNLPVYLNNLGAGLSERYERTGSLADLRRAIEAFERAVEKTPEGSPDLPGYLNNLGIGLVYHYTRTGLLIDLHRVIEMYEQAVEQTPAGASDLPIYLNSLGNGLRGRYARLGKMIDLQRAIEAYEEAVQRMHEDSPDLPIYLNNLGNGLNDRYARTQELNDLQKAMEAYQEAIQQTPDGAPALPGYLNNLGNVLKDRYVQTEELKDLTQAIQLWKRAVEQTQDGSFALAGYLNNLGDGLRNRYSHSQEEVDLKQAVEAHEKAVGFTPSGSPQRPVYLNNLGNALRIRYARSGKGTDLMQAIASYEEACQLGMERSLEEALGASRNWGDWASQREEWAEAERAYGYGMAAIERLYRVQLTRWAKETWLREARGLPARAAYARARAGDPTDAVLALERGRARLLSEILERDRVDLNALEQAHPDRYAAYRRAADRVSALSGLELRPNEMPSGFDLAAEMRAARAELDTAVEAIRDLPGYADFLTAPGWEDIAGAATPEQPLVYLAATPAGGLALVVAAQTSEVVRTSSPETSEVSALWLDDLTEEVLREQLMGPADDPELSGYLGAYNAWRRNPRDEDARAAWLEAIDETTRWLWDVAMGPIVEEVAVGDASHRATLIPAGLMGLLPLHAAWSGEAHHHIQFTYAPNARATLAARETAEEIPAPHNLLAIDNPDRSLRFSEEEVAAALDTFPQSHRLHLANDQATLKSVRDNLSRHDVWHFSTHGWAGWSEPLESGLLLVKGKQLTLRDLLALDAPARLAVLSACETGVPGMELPDEVVSLPTGLLQAGVAGVVGSLWAVNDFSTALLMMRFYQAWREEGQAPPEAIHTAQRWLRESTNADFEAYFKRQLPVGAAERLPIDVASDAYRRFYFESDQDTRPFAHPFHWAGFYYTGV
jgi:tetratricopeptide (TPR) repeat protein